MNESAVDALGVRPLAPLLDRIAAMRSKKDLPGTLAALHLASDDDGLLFGFASAQDYADSTRVIAFANAGGRSRGSAR